MVAPLALALAALFLLGAVAVTAAPTSTSGAQCGWWVNPEWNRDESERLATTLINIGDQSRALRVAENWRDCDAALSGRRTVTFVLLGAGVVIPVAVLFVAGGRRRQPSS